MTLKEMFKKVEAYNEIAELMRTDKAVIYLYSKDCHTGKEFSKYEDLRKWVRKEFIKGTADRVLNHDGWEFDKEYTFNWIDNFGWEFNSTFTAELIAD